jgi:hypothetical protein
MRLWLAAPLPPLLAHTGSSVALKINSTQLTPTIAASASTTFNNLEQQVDKRKEKV